jgi:hypothetical protein
VLLSYSRYRQAAAGPGRTTKCIPTKEESHEACRVPRNGKGSIYEDAKQFEASGFIKIIKQLDYGVMVVKVGQSYVKAGPKALQSSQRRVKECGPDDTERGDLQKSPS